MTPVCHNPPGRVAVAAAAMLIAALHPWQGAMLVGVIGAAALWQALAREAAPPPAITKAHSKKPGDRG